MKSKLLKLASMMMILCLVTAFMPVSMASAEEVSDAPKITISVDGTIYENIKFNDEFLVKNLNDMVIEILSVDGHKLVNVGNKSGVLDSQGRTVLEISKNEVSNELWVVRLCYHAMDDPVEANHGHGFDITGLKFKSSEDAKVTIPTVSKVTKVKLAPKSKSIKVTWKKSSSISGYQIQYARTKSAVSSAKKIKVSKSKTTYTIGSLKAKKKYYVRIRAYKNYTDTLGNAAVVYGKWVNVNTTTK